MQSSALKNRDDFFIVVYEFFEGLSKRPKLLIIAAVALVGGGFLIAHQVNHREAVQESAKSALYAAQQAIEGKTPEKASPYQKIDVDSQYGDGIKKLATVAENYPGTRASFEAVLQIGNLYYDHQSPEKAILWFSKAADGAPAQLEKASALSALGHAQENAGKFSDALQSYDKAINLGEGSLQGDLLLAKARCEEALHDVAQARSTYDQILAKLPETESSRIATILKNELTQ